METISIIIVIYFITSLIQSFLWNNWQTDLEKEILEFMLENLGPDVDEELARKVAFATVRISFFLFWPIIVLRIAYDDFCHFIRWVFIDKQLDKIAKRLKKRSTSVKKKKKLDN